MSRIAMVLVPRFQFFPLGVQVAFEMANGLLGKEAYSFALHSPFGGTLTSSTGLALPTQPLADAGAIDTMLVLGGVGVFDPLDMASLDILRAAAGKARRVAAICTGAFVLAQMGLLDGRRATTHWDYARLMRERFPAVRLEADRMFVNDGDIWTSAGVSAGLDLAIALVESDHGRELASAVARRLVLHHRRAGGQLQHSEPDTLAADNERINRALAHARAHLTDPLHVDDLARVAGLSPRQFSRAFRAETGQSPAKAVELLRLKMAMRLLEDSSHTLEQVARETGFVDLRRMRDAFMRHHGQPPQALRRLARAA